MRAPRAAGQMLQSLLSGAARQQQGALASMRRRLAGAPLTSQQKEMWEQLQRALAPPPAAARPAPEIANTTGRPILKPPSFASPPGK